LANSKTGVLEIGPGLGTLTLELAERAKKVVAIELDKKLLPVLDDTLRDFENVKIIQGDIEKIDIQNLLNNEFGDMPVNVCANLPYYITSPIIMRFLNEKIKVKNLTFMIQKETAQRICALPGQKQCGAISFAVSYFAKAQTLFEVSGGSFFPKPKVDSAVLRLEIRETPAVKVKDEKLFFRVINSAFKERRKTFANALSRGMCIKKELAQTWLSNANIESTRRIETCSLEELAKLSNFITNNGFVLLK
jgi:16S rRNA (adenine1518-N6/adenine1519-N6)-dimethyltransferase